MLQKRKVRQLREVTPVEKSIDKEKIEAAVRMILEAIGEDPERPGLLETPARVARAYEELFYGVGRDAADELSTFFEVENDQLVVVKDIPFYSVCEHHLLPFIGKAHVAYLPRGGKITGLSKLARTVEMAARRPQLQERLTVQVADALMERLNPWGAIVVVEAEHLCMTMRGIKKPGSVTVTSAIRGSFTSDAASRAEAFALLNHGHSN